MACQEAAVGAGPSQLDDFQFIERIGHGSFGTVHKVKRKADGTIYVIKQVKMISMSRKEQEAAINEVRILASLDSPYVIKYYDSFIDGDSLNIVMELAEHGNLSQWLKKHRAKPVPENVVWRFFIQLVAGMHHIHERNIVHRDLKALNIMLDNKDNIKIGDLGVAKVLTTHLRAAHTGVGTPYYLSPEVAQRRPYNAKSDVWALGCILYECCTRRHPFTGNTQAQLFQQIIRATYRPISTQYSAGIHEAVKACLTRSVEQRPSPFDIMLMPAFLAKAKEMDIEMPREVLLRLGTAGINPRGVAAAAANEPKGNSVAESRSSGQRVASADARNMMQRPSSARPYSTRAEGGAAAAAAGVGAEPAPEPELRGPPRAEPRARPSSGRVRLTSGMSSAAVAQAAVGDEAAAGIVAGLRAAPRPQSAAVGGRVRQQRQSAARLSSPGGPQLRRGQRRVSSDAASSGAPAPVAAGGIGLGLGWNGRRPASAGPARQRPSSAGPRPSPAPAPAPPSPRAVVTGHIPGSAGTPRRVAASAVSPAPAQAPRGGNPPPQRSAAAEVMARRGISPSGPSSPARPVVSSPALVQRPSSAPAQRRAAGGRDEAQLAADSRRAAAAAMAKASGQSGDARWQSGGSKWVEHSGRGDAQAVAAAKSPPQSAGGIGRMQQRQVPTANGVPQAHAGSPTPRIRQRNGFLRPQSAGAQPRPAPGRAAASSGAAQPTVQQLSGVRARLGGQHGGGGQAGSRPSSARPSSARVAHERAQKVAHQKAVDDVRSLPSY